MDGSEPPQRRADQWFQNPIQTLSIKQIGPFSPTADGACAVELPDGTRAYVKPRPDAERNLVVAREKIAADLGYLLELRVAPVVVRVPEVPEWRFHSALSSAELPSARQWGDGGVNHIEKAACDLEALRVFWTWLGDNDHNGHPGNVVYGVKSGTCTVMAIDHSYSLCHGNHADPLAVGMCQGYGTADRADCELTRRTTAAKVLSLDWSKVEGVVRRLKPILADAEQDRIIGILKRRQGHLPTFLGM